MLLLPLLTSLALAPPGEVEPVVLAPPSAGSAETPAGPDAADATDPDRAALEALI